MSLNDFKICVINALQIACLFTGIIMLIDGAWHGILIVAIGFCLPFIKGK